MLGDQQEEEMCQEHRATWVPVTSFFFIFPALHPLCVQPARPGTQRHSQLPQQRWQGSGGHKAWALPSHLLQPIILVLPMEGGWLW